MELKNIKTINLPDIVKELEMMKIDYTNSLQIIEEFGSDNDQAVYVGSLIYGLEAPKDFTFTITKNNYTIVDGMKRLNAIMLFISNKVTVGGKHYSDFTIEQLNEVKLTFTTMGINTDLFRLLNQ